jgi:leader peptidase (prepilin peptidase)/N-methyltransferase
MKLIQFIELGLHMILIGSIASFYSTIYYRIEKYFYLKERKNHSFLQKWQKIFLERSSCESCNTNINSIYLFPVLGYLLQTGKCKNCKAKINTIYPLFELFLILFFLALFYYTSDYILSYSFIFLIGHLWISINTDLNFYSLDYENLPFIFLFGFILNFRIFKHLPLPEDYFVFLGFLFFFGLLYFFYSRGIGLGDVIYAPFFAFLSGHPYWMFFLNSSYFLGILFSFLFLKKTKMSFRKTPIPMGVFFSISLILTFIMKLIHLLFYPDLIF